MCTVMSRYPDVPNDAVLEEGDQDQISSFLHVFGGCVCLYRAVGGLAGTHRLR